MNWEEEIQYYLEKLAYKHGITIERVPLRSHVPDVAVPHDKLVIMNVNSNIKYKYVYRLAHELAHILYGDPNDHKAYSFSIGAKRAEEIMAHKNAVKLLAEYDGGFTNYADACVWFGIPSFMEETVREYVVNYK